MEVLEIPSKPHQDSKLEAILHLLGNHRDRMAIVKDLKDKGDDFFHIPI